MRPAITRPSIDFRSETGKAQKPVGPLTDGPMGAVPFEPESGLQGTNHRKGLLLVGGRRGQMKENS